MSEGGVSQGYVDNQVSALRSDLRHLESEVNALQRWAEHEFQRLENEMKEVGDKIIYAINQQTIAVVGGVAATTAMMASTKVQLEQDFSLTREKIEIQTESALQIEVGKKVAEAGSLKAKLDAFLKDIKDRFDRSIAGVVINRELYSLNFKKITDEYENKIRTIGEHIFQVKTEDIAPAVKAAQVLYEDAHSLPIEMDLKRLSARAECLDQTLEMLKTSRLDEVVSSLDTLDNMLKQYSAPGVAADASFCVEGVAVTSANSANLLVGLVASAVTAGEGIVLTPADESLQVFASESESERITRALDGRNFRDLTGEEIMALSKAASALKSRQFISEDAMSLFEDFLGSGSLKYLEA